MLAAFVVVSECIVRQAHQVKDRGMQIAEVDLAFNGTGTGVIRAAVA